MAVASREGYMPAVHGGEAGCRSSDPQAGRAQTREGENSHLKDICRGEGISTKWLRLGMLIIQSQLFKKDFNNFCFTRCGYVRKG